MTDNDPTKRIHLIGNQFIRDMNRRHQLLLQEMERRFLLLEKRYQILKEKDVRFGLTTSYDPETETEGTSLDYPEDPCNTYWVKLGAPSFTQAEGNQTLVVTAYDPPEYRLVHSPYGYLPAFNTIVPLVMSHGLYFSLAGIPEDFVTEFRVFDNKLQYKTRKGLAIGPESDWLDIDSVLCADLGA